VTIVFVHGVATRRDEPGGRYDRLVADRDELFRRLALDGVVADVTQPILSPYWGLYGASPAWNLSSLPSSKLDAFGGGIGHGEAVAATIFSATSSGWTQDDDCLAVIARERGLAEAVDLLVALGLDGFPSVVAREVLDVEPERLAVNMGAAMFEFASLNPRPSWLSNLQTGAELLAHLMDEVQSGSKPSKWDAYGSTRGWERFSEGVSRLNLLAPRLASRGVLRLTRSAIQERITDFLGDIFIYLHDGERRTNIQQTIAAAILEAANLRSAGNPLIVVAHSMGANICYDLLSSLLVDVQVDVFVSVGSQVGFFEELKLFNASDDAIGAGAETNRVPRPKTVRRWLNVVDATDPLSFVIEPIFDSPDADFAYNTGAGLLMSHSAYWLRPSFHARLGERLRAAS
jgi:hypothetical protein